MINNLNSENWIKLYIYWEQFLIKELGFEINFTTLQNKNKKDQNLIKINDKVFKIPTFLLEKNKKNVSNLDIKEALNFNKNIFLENFIIPNRLKFPLSRNILEKYYN